MTLCYLNMIVYLFTYEMLSVERLIRSSRQKIFNCYTSVGTRCTVRHRLSFIEFHAFVADCCDFYAVI